MSGTNTIGTNRLDWIVGAGKPLTGRIRVPGDKSVSHRAIMLASLAEGVSRIDGFLEGEDTRATAAVFQQLGVKIEAPSPQSRIVHGVGLRGLRASAAALDCGNAGTGMRLLAGVLAGQAFDSALVGDASLSKRPMRRVMDPLAKMGAVIDSESGGLPPLRIHGGSALQGIDYTLPVASAQVQSAVLLPGLYADGETVVREPHPTRDYTERMLSAFGWPMEFSPGLARIRGGADGLHALRATDVSVPADFSSAAFFLVAASVIPGSDLILEAVGMNPRRTGLLQALRGMGADIVETNARNQGGEAVADLRVRATQLQGIDVPEEIVPDMIDEFPALFVAAAAADGPTVVRGGAGNAHALRATDVHVPADFSSAAFFLVAASVIPGSDLVLEAVGMNPRRTGLLQALRAMGADIVETDARSAGGEAVADLHVRAAPLRGIAVPEAIVPDMIDEFPALFVAAACAEGETRITGAAELRVKESDRLATMSAALRALGIRVDESDDGAIIHGGAFAIDPASPVRIDSHGDHRIAMASAIAGQRCDGEFKIGDIANVATSFPGFDALARGVGFALREA